MPYGNLLADVVQSSTVGTPPQFNDGGGTQVGTLCRAWCVFNGSAATVTASFNFSSVTRIGVTDYTVNFTNAMSDANYSVVAMNNQTTYTAIKSGTTPTSLSFNLITGGATDTTRMSVAVFR